MAAKKKFSLHSWKRGSGWNVKDLLHRDQGACKVVRDIGLTTRYFVTRRGKKIQTSEDLETYHKTDLLPKRQLHPIIAQKVWSLFLQGDYDTAVFQAFKQVEIAVRKKGNYAEMDLGVSLMRDAFHPEDGSLTDLNQQQAEKQGRSDYLPGRLGPIKILVATVMLK